MFLPMFLVETVFITVSGSGAVVIKNGLIERV